MRSSGPLLLLLLLLLWCISAAESSIGKRKKNMWMPSFFPAHLRGALQPSSRLHEPKNLCLINIAALLSHLALCFIWLAFTIPGRSPGIC
jgi:hypothetical protein